MDSISRRRRSRHKDSDRGQRRDLTTFSPGLDRIEPQRPGPGSGAILLVVAALVMLSMGVVIMVALGNPARRIEWSISLGGGFESHLTVDAAASARR